MRPRVPRCYYEQYEITLKVLASNNLPNLSHRGSDTAGSEKTRTNACLPDTLPISAVGFCLVATQTNQQFHLGLTHSPVPVLLGFTLAFSISLLVSNSERRMT